MARIQRVTGMQDVLPDDQRYWRWLLNTAHEVAGLYGFRQIDVPVLEYTDLFERGVGTASDFFVQKEMYTIEEEDGSSITMRPEFTAGIVRAYIEHGMHNLPQPVKLYATGPIFRRERPQAGRFRQHSQLNCEILGEIDPAADVELIMLAINLFRRLGFAGLTLQINSTGCPECKPVYVALLREYLAEYLHLLSDVDQERLRRNPLRVLDSKERGMEELLAHAPHISDHLCEDCADHFAELRRLLDTLGQSYSINYRLVRGIDYYVKTVFEVWATGIGAQSALVGGGRYDGLAEAIGGAHTPAVGFGSGIERLVMVMQNQGLAAPPAELPQVMVAHFGSASKVAAVQTVERLRSAGIGAYLSFARSRRSLKSQLREANKYLVRFALIIGEEELADGTVIVKPMAGGDQERILITELVSYLSTASRLHSPGDDDGRS